MKTLLLSIFGILSFVFNIISMLYSVKLYKYGKREKTILSSIQAYTIGVFISVVLSFIPIYYTAYSFGDRYIFSRPILLSIHSSLQVFFLNCDFEIITNAIKGQSTWFNVLYSSHCAFLYVIAPIMTFTNVLSLFKNIKSEIRFLWHKYNNLYILSELNLKSVALAKSIYKMDKNATIVFADVFEQNKEEAYELLLQVHDINAICLKRDASHLNILNKNGNVEIFLIGENEAENVSQAVRITTELNSTNTKQNVKIFVFSRKNSSAYILNSIKYENLIHHAGKSNYDDSSFKLRRINEVQQLVWHTVPNMNVFDIAQNNNNTISILIAGMGSYGMEFFKTLVWFCQFEGYKLKITIVDKMTNGDDGKRDITSIINHQCPELLKKNRSTEDGEAYYDVEILSGIDFGTSDFEDIALYNGNDEGKTKLSQRIKDTNVIIVSLGDDDLNIETAVGFRCLFDKLYKFKAVKETKPADEKVQIYSIVYDEQKSGILRCNDGESSFLMNHKYVPYNIHFIGGMSSQFDYFNIYDSELEKKAYTHHIEWVDIEEKIYNDWNEKDKKKTKDYSWSFNEEKTDVAKANARRNYEKFEYYRLSSMAKELYQNAINNSLASLTKCKEKDKKQTCECENCIRRKKSEHMRWNAYTRSIGYIYNADMKADRAGYHYNLCGWDGLSELEKAKD